MLGLVLVYAGEHYVTDLLLGAGLAVGTHGVGALLTGTKVRLPEAVIQPGPRGQRIRRAAR